MLTDMKQAPIIEDATFTHVYRKVLCDEAVTIKSVQCAWIEQDGGLYVNDDLFPVEATLVPIVHLATKAQWQKFDVDAAGWNESAPVCTEFPVGQEVTLNDEHGDGLLDALAMVLRNPNDNTLCAYVFNGHANELVRFDPSDQMHDVFDTVYTMFAVTGQAETS